MDLTCDWHDVRDWAVIRVVGELDMDTASHLSRVVDQAFKRGRRSFAFDLSRVTFCDSSGLSVLVEARRQPQVEQGKIALVHPSENVMKLLRITGLGQVLPIHQTDQEATDELSH